VEVVVFSLIFAIAMLCEFKTLALNRARKLSKSLLALLIIIHIGYGKNK